MTSIQDPNQRALFIKTSPPSQGLGAPAVTEVFQPVSAQAFDPDTGEFCRDRPSHGRWVFIQTAYDAGGKVALLLHINPRQSRLGRGHQDAPRYIDVTGVELSGWEKLPSEFSLIENPYSTLVADRIVLVTTFDVTMPASVALDGRKPGLKRPRHCVRKQHLLSGSRNSLV